MNHQFGDASVIAPFDDDSMRLILVDGPLNLAWQHCGITADFFGTFYSSQVSYNSQRTIEVRHNVAFVVNEILENAVKFRSSGDVTILSKIDCFDGEDKFRLCVNHSVNEKSARCFETFLITFVNLKGRDPSDLLIDRLEANAANPNSSGSGLGLLTLMSDYGVRLGWEFKRSGERGHSVQLECHAVLAFG